MICNVSFNLATETGIGTTVAEIDHSAVAVEPAIVADLEGLPVANFVARLGATLAERMPPGRISKDALVSSDQGKINFTSHLRYVTLAIN